MEERQIWPSANTIPRKVSAPPPVYRPQPQATQLKAASPPVYRPDAATRAKPAGPGVRGAPRVYRPNAPVQAKSAGLGVAPSVYRPQSQATQLKAAAPPVYRPNKATQTKPAGPCVGGGPPALCIQGRAFPVARFPLHFEAAPGVGGAIIQRQLVVDGDSLIYGPQHAEAFKAKYANQLEEITEAMEAADVYLTIDGALNAPQTIFVRQRDSGELWVESAAARSAVPGGTTRAVSALPELAVRPQTGFEQFTMSGLINCVGILLEARRGPTIEAIAGCHFDTPKFTEVAGQGEQKTRIIRPDGVAAIQTMLHFARKHGDALRALLWYVENPSSSGIDAGRVVVAIAKVLHEQNVQVVTSRGVGSRTYTLHSDGTGG